MPKPRQDSQIADPPDGHVVSEQIVSEMLRLFRGDNRRVMHQKPDGTYGPLHLGPLSTQDLQRHLRGEVSVSIYLLDAECKCSTLCFDVDIPKVEIPRAPTEREQKKRQEFLPIALGIIEHIISTYNVPQEAFLLEDTGGRGYHVWMFFAEAQPGDEVVSFAHRVRRYVNMESIEVFPPNWQHGPSGFSKSNVRLPLGVHRKYSGKRSTVIDPRTRQAVPFAEIARVLREVSFVSPTVLEHSRLASISEIDKGAAELASSGGPTQDISRVWTYPSDPQEEHLECAVQLCPALARLISKARCDGHLKHHERVALALTVAHHKDGPRYLHEILRNCADYSPDKTQAQIDSLLRYRPISCRTLQSPKYAVCGGWCRPKMKELADKGRYPTPLSLLQKRADLQDKGTDASDELLIDEVASMENLLRAWQQARTQAKERDIFEDVLAYQAFEDHLEANLHILRMEILSGCWEHRPFRLVLVPKSSEEPDNVRPMCLSSPWDSIVACAVLNVIGPTIDSTFHENSLGNRLVHGPASEGQIFEDWRKQNRSRELRIAGFSEYGDGRYYVLTDITRCYEFIQHDRLMASLRARIEDQQVLDIVEKFLKAPWLLDGVEWRRGDGTYNRAVGLPQGPALSAFLANVYLDTLDNWLEMHCLDFVRYVDDLALVFETRELADATMGELRGFLEKGLGLRLSNDPKKTLGPFPTSNTAPLDDWLRDVRYQLHKYSRREGTLTPVEKENLRTALAMISGAELGQQSDIDRLVKYLGFYVACTERLDQNRALQKGVYNLALFVMNELRPKHNATCIAMRALVKACSEFGEAAWAELKRLLDLRSDPYIHVVFMQEARRFIEGSQAGAELYSGLKREIERQMSSSSQIVAAAAMECVAAVGASRFPTAAGGLLKRFRGNDEYLRSRAAFLLSQLDALDATGSARIIPSSGDEIALLLFATKSPPVWSRAVIDSIAGALKAVPCALHAVPALLFASLATGSLTGIKACSSIESLVKDQSLRHVCHYVAARYIQFVIASNNVATTFADTIQLSFDGGLPLLGCQLYDLGRYSKVIAEMPQLDKLVAEKAAPCETGANIPRLPTMEGVSLNTLLLSSRPPSMWLHEATDVNGFPLFHEVIAESGLQAYGCRVTLLAEALHALRNEGLLVLDDVQITGTASAEYLMTRCTNTGEWHTVAEMLRNGSLDTAQQKAGVVAKAAALLDRAKDVLQQHDLPSSLLPVPTCHSLVMDWQGAMRFRTVLATLAGGRHYVGLDLQREPILLPHDQWEVYALGMFFFEVATAKCAVSPVNGSPMEERLADTAECLVRGPLFSGIVGKATARQPNKRYKNADLLVNDVNEWSRLETAIARHQLGARQIDLLRRLWHTEISLGRRAHEVVEVKGSLLASAPELATYIFEQLEQEGQPGGMWSDRHLRTIVASRNTGLDHVVTLYTVRLAERLREQWDTLNAACGLERDFTSADWLVYAATLCELETVRRKLFTLARTTLSSVCSMLCVYAADAVASQANVRVKPQGLCEKDREERLAIQLGAHLLDICEHLHPWLVVSTRETWPEPQWSTHLPLLAMLIVVLNGRLTVSKGDGAEILISVKRRGKSGFGAAKAAEYILTLHQHELLAESCPASIDASVINGAAQTALALCRVMPQAARTRVVYGLLPKNSFSSLYAAGLSELDLGPQLGRKKPLLASRSSLLPFPELCPSHGNGCPFSLSLVETPDIGNPLVLALSLPPVVERGEDGIAYPAIKGEPRLACVRRAIQRLIGSPRVRRLAPFLIVVGCLVLIYLAEEAGCIPDNRYIRLVKHLLEAILD